MAYARWDGLEAALANAVARTELDLRLQLNGIAIERRKMRVMLPAGTTAGGIR